MKRILAAALLAGVGLMAPTIASAETAEETAAAFGARQAVLDMSLSPSGTKFAYIAPTGSADEVLRVVDIATGENNSILVADDANVDLTWCLWATDERLICQLYVVRKDLNYLLGFTRLLSISSDGKDLVRMTEEVGGDQFGLRQNGGTILAYEIDGEPGKVLMTHQFIPEQKAASRTNRTLEGLGVVLKDVESGKYEIVESPSRNAVGYRADENGRVRIMATRRTDQTGYSTDTLRYFYRAADDDDWLPLDIARPEGMDEQFYPISVNSAENVAYGFADKGKHEALYRVALDGSGKAEALVARDDVDVDGLLRIGRKRRVVGATYATEKRQVEYFDAELDGLAKALGNALPGKPLIGMADSSADESRLLVVASSDTDPGMVYLFDKSSKQLSEVIPIRDFMGNRALAPMTPVTFPAQDGTRIPGYLTLPPASDGKNVPAIVLPHGGPGSRDEWGFDWLPQYFAARGYAVLQPNFRGSAGYGEDWFGDNGFQAWETAIGDVNDAGRWLVEQGTANPDRLAIVGWSYGGYAALQSQVLDPALYKAVVAIAPVTDLNRLKTESKKYANYRFVAEFIGEGPHIRQGSPAQNADRFTAPVLMFHGTYDQNVDYDHSQLMKDKLESAGKQVDYIEYDRLDHSLSDSLVRRDMLMKIDRFLAESLAQ